VSRCQLFVVFDNNFVFFNYQEFIAEQGRNQFVVNDSINTRKILEFKLFKFLLIGKLQGVEIKSFLGAIVKYI
jgi:hypothetical protein